jgi:hypothetical protein
VERSLSFYLNGRTVYCQYYARDGRVQMSAGIKIEDKEAFKSGKIRKDHAAHLDRLKAVVYRYEVDCRQWGKPTSVAEVEALLLEELNRTGKPHIGRKDSVLSVYKRYLAGVKSGEILNRGKRYSDSWIAVATSIQDLIESNDIGAVQASLLNERDLARFSSAITSKGQKVPKGQETAKSLSKNTVATYMAVFVGILNNARRMGWFKGPAFDTKVFRTGWDNIDHGIYLTTDEIKQLTALDYSGEHAAWRDGFVLGCFLGMRYSDLSRLTAKHRRDNLVNINTKKTGAAVWVPLTPIAREIWGRWDGLPELPRRDTFTRFIKRMGRDAGIDKRVLFSRTEGGKVKEKWVHTYELMGTHTMRRSAATNMYLAGIPVPSIMKITGHKDHASFLRYIRLSDEEHAVLLSEHAYFK